MSLLIAESGSTKTDWRLIQPARKPVKFDTGGINPRLQTNDEIIEQLGRELKWNPNKHPVSSIVYYGAGVGSPAIQKELTATLKQFFNVKKIDVYSDIIGAARGLCGDKKGIVSIIGTGSNSCYYNGRSIKDQQVSLGFIAGDEGSGNHMGKRVLQYYAYNTFDTELRMAFEQLFGGDIPAILHKLYKEPFPNRYLATYVQLLAQNRGHYMVENIIEDCLNDFFHHHILKYRQSWKLPLYFTGSVAFEFKDVIQRLCDQYELDMGTVAKSPLDGLVKYHTP
ncbi:MAG: N-acetylglucosamine kinase [Flavipsychrobacter sp.]|nr:N-acetylglucosamine kinase [Flavipsychrobacter sp.]